MLKKVFFVGAAVALLAGLLSGRDAISYVATSLGQVRDSVRGAVPVEFEITRARDMIRELDPEIEKNMAKIAEEEYEVEELAQKIDANKEQLALARGQILRVVPRLALGLTERVVFR